MKGAPSLSLLLSSLSIALMAVMGQTAAAREGHREGLGRIQIRSVQARFACAPAHPVFVSIAEGESQEIPLPPSCRGVAKRLSLSIACRKNCTATATLDDGRRFTLIGPPDRIILRSAVAQAPIIVQGMELSVSGATSVRVDRDPLKFAPLRITGTKGKDSHFSQLLASGRSFLLRLGEAGRQSEFEVFAERTGKNGGVFIRIWIASGKELVHRMVQEGHPFTIRCSQLGVVCHNDLMLRVDEPDWTPSATVRSQVSASSPSGRSGRATAPPAHGR